MDKLAYLFIAIVQEALTGKKTTQVISDPRGLYVLARENGLSGTVYKSLEKKLPDKEIEERFKRDFLKYIADDARKLTTRKTITATFSQHGIDHMYLKGTTLKEVYPESYMRSMGDIDVLVREKEKERAKHLLLEAGFTEGPKSKVHDILFDEDVEVELHCMLLDEERFPDYSELNRIWNHVYPLQNHEYRMIPEYEVVYLLFHLEKHLLSSGAGLRNVLDIGLFLDRKLPDPKRLQALLVSTRLDTFFQNLVMFNDRYLDLDLEKRYLVNPVFDPVLFDGFTDYVLTSGIHGLGIGHNFLNTRFAADKNKKRSLVKSVLALLFPPYREMKNQYPRLLKCKLLLPIAWIMRMFRILFRKTRRVLIYFRLVKDANLAKVNDLSKMFEKMGL